MRKCSFITKGEIYEKNSCIFTVPCQAFSLCACKGSEPEPTAQPTAQPTPEESYAPVSFRNHGKQSTVTALPQKVVTAGPNCTEIFCALGPCR